MTEQFSNLNKKEQALVIDAPALVTIWIAGSEENVNQAEMDGALDEIGWKSIKARPDLLSYYKEVNKNFSVRLKEILQQLPKEKEARDAEVVKQLSGLNAILPKFSQPFAEQLYASFQELARRVAESSGGFLGYNSVDSEEMERIHLPMIQDPRT